MIKQAILCALGAASLAIPGVSSAQSYYGQGDRYDSNGGYAGQGEDRGDYQNGYNHYGYGHFNGYPEFRGLEQHIRSEIIQSRRQDMIDQDGAQDLLNQLREIKIDQNREFQRHGWQLPDDDRYRIRSAYERLDREVDRIRQEPEG